VRIAAAVFLTAILLAGCATPAEQAATAQREVERMVRVYGPACDTLGYKRDTDPWRDCVMRLAAKDELGRYNFYVPSPYRYWAY
jgi:hypothetical protein